MCKRERKKRAMLIRTVVMSFISIVLLVILIMRSSMTTRTVYKFGFFLGFAVLLVVLFLPMRVSLR